MTSVTRGKIPYQATTTRNTITDVALVGGGGYPQPGEISLAHNGVLFLDELPEYKRAVLEVMRQPMEDRMVTISRAKFTIDFPANFVLIAAMNPCPCGYYSHPERSCSCPSGTVERYLNRVSGPLLDRIDLHIEVTPVSYNELQDERKGESSESIRERVNKARIIQIKRFESERVSPSMEFEKVHELSFEDVTTATARVVRQHDHKEVMNERIIASNAEMSSKQIRNYCALDSTCADILKRAMEKFGFSARAYDRILKVARTIADLDAEEHIAPRHIAEAIQYRSLDRLL